MNPKIVGKGGGGVTNDLPRPLNGKKMFGPNRVKRGPHTMADVGYLAWSIT